MSVMFTVSVTSAGTPVVVVQVVPALSVMMAALRFPVSTGAFPVGKRSCCICGGGCINIPGNTADYCYLFFLKEVQCPLTDSSGKNGGNAFFRKEEGELSRFMPWIFQFCQSYRVFVLNLKDRIAFAVAEMRRHDTAILSDGNLFCLNHMIHICA